MPEPASGGCSRLQPPPTPVSPVPLARRGINIPLRSVPAEPMPMAAFSLPGTFPPPPAPAFAIAAAEPPRPLPGPPRWLCPPPPRCGAEGGCGALAGPGLGFGGAMGAPCGFGRSAGPAPGGFLHPRGVSGPGSSRGCRSDIAETPHVCGALCFVLPPPPAMLRVRGMGIGGGGLVSPCSTWTHWVKPTEMPL